jgi:Putative phage abortive infection protein
MLVGLTVAVILFFHFSLFELPWVVPSAYRGHLLGAADKIAAASALFSALAFVAVVYAILLQHADLVQQQEEQEVLQSQVDEQRAHLRSQTEAIERQNFENTFFHLLRLHNTNVRTQRVQLVPNGIVERGRQAFVVASRQLQWMLEARLKDPKPVAIEEVNDFYARVCEIPDSQFGHYFRNLYHIVRYVKESAPGDKTRYTSQLRAQFSQAEFELLFVNGLRRGGSSKFFPLIVEFRLLHEMVRPPALEGIRGFYPNQAFGTPEAWSKSEG